MPPAPPLTHFLCIPLITSTTRPHLKNSLARFKDHVTKLRSTELPDGIPEKAVRPLGTLHLTLGVMSLLTPERVENALTVLRGLDLAQLLAGSNPRFEKVSFKSKAESLSSSDLRADPLPINMRGLVSMHTPSKTSILYCPPLDPDLRLYNFCQKLREAFIAADLIALEDRPLLLHATIVNTVYVPGVREKGSGHGKRKSKLTLNVGELLEEYEDFVWMDGGVVEKIAIFRMGAKKNEAGEEEYVVEGEVEMPS